MKKLTFVFALIALSYSSQIYAGLASADFNYMNDLIGDRATGLGGAYVAISDDPAGAYYNPAGLAFAFDNQISLSVNTYKVKELVYEKALYNENYNQTINSFYPSFFGVVQSIGSAKLAIVFINSNNEILDQDDAYKNITISQTGGDITANTYVNYNNTDNTFLFGLSTGFFVNKKFTMGFSLFALNRRREQIFNQVNEIVDPGGCGTCTAGDLYVTNIYRTDDFWGLLSKVGVQFMPFKKLSFGLTIGAGGILSHKNETQTMQNGAISSSSGDVSGSAIPTEIRAGVAYFPSNKLLLTADVIGHFGTTNYDTSALNTYNFAIGTEYYIIDILPVRFGLFTNFANTAEIDKSKTRQDMHVDMYGASTSISVQSRNSSITLSGFYQYGEGESQIGTDTTATENVVIHMYQISLTGTAKY